MQKRENEVRAILLTIIISWLFQNFIDAARTIYRPHDSQLPRIIVYWPNDSQRYILRDSHLEEVSIFKKFDRDYFENHMIPHVPILYRNHPDISVEGEVLSKLLEEFLEELRRTKVNKKEFKNFIVLKSRDFNFKECSGLIVLKFKDYPFVIKLFIENPRSFIKPFSKGIEPGFFFIMGGGINRYLSGFTRVKNLEYINKRIAEDDYWKKYIDTPRKWFWQPCNNAWFIIEGDNIGICNHQSIMVPSVYGIVCDAIESEGSLRLVSKANRRLGIRLSHFFGCRVDPHIDNFVIEQETHKIVLVDTEHFPTMVGLQEPLEFDNYFSWYYQLSWKYACNKYGRSKSMRRALQCKEVSELAFC